MENNNLNFKVISGHGFAEISDFIFASHVKTQRGFESVIYPLNINILNDNDVIYCKTDFIGVLFEQIKHLDVSLKLITSESDYSITKNLFDKKPNCIKKWFAINVEYQHQDLIPIPLGVSNPNCTITLKVNSIKNNNIEKEKLLYINHRIETNANVRKPIYNLFKTNDWCTILQPNLSLQDYELNLKKHHYMLCPRGNGVDTHRLWECLYSGVVPIVQKQITHNNLYDLPILFVDNYEQITEDFLKENLFKLKNKNLEKLNLYWWGNFIKEKNEWTNK